MTVEPQNREEQQKHSDDDHCEQAGHSQSMDLLLFGQIPV